MVDDDADLGKRGNGPTRRSLPAGVRWGVGAVARRLGVAIPTLRSWERRYGLGPSGRTAGGHRRYSESDIARIEQMAQLIRFGVTAAEAARSLAAAASPAEAAPDESASAAGRRERHDQSQFHGPHRGLQRAMQLLQSPEMSRVLTWAMLGATRGLDGALLSRMLSQVFDARGLVAGWTEVVVPLLDEIGTGYRTGAVGVGAEHLASECIAAELRARMRHQPGSRATARVLLAGAGGDRHALPLLALAVALSELGIASSVLGETPPDELANAVSRMRPRVIFVWSSLWVDGQAPRILEKQDITSGSRPDPLLLLGGPGWADEARRSERHPGIPVERMADLGSTVSRIRELVN